MNSSLTVINNHYILAEEPKYPGIHGPSVEEFSSTVSKVSKQYEIISPHDLQSLNPFNSRYCLFTFDDGLLCQYEPLESIFRQFSFIPFYFISTLPLISSRPLDLHVLHKIRSLIPPIDFYLIFQEYVSRNLPFHPALTSYHSLAATHYRYDTYPTNLCKYFFNYIMTSLQRDEFVQYLVGFVDLDLTLFYRNTYFTEFDIQKLDAQYSCIGSHSHQHIPLGNLPNISCKHELQTSKDILESCIKRPVNSISYPSGNSNAVNSSVFELARSVGYQTGFTMHRSSNSVETNLQMSRYDYNDAALYLSSL